MILPTVENAASDRRRTHRPAPLLPIAIGLIAGITIDNAVRVPPTIAVATAMIAVLFAAATMKQRRDSAYLIAIVFVLSAATGAIRHAVKMRYLPDNHIARIVDDEPRILTVTGRVISVPRIVERPRDSAIAYPTSPKTRFILHVEAVEGDHERIDAVGKLNVTVKEPMPMVRLGDVIRITGRLYRPMRPANPGMYDWALLQQREGIHAALSTDHAAAVTTLSESRADTLAGLITAARDRTRQYLLNDSVLESDPAAGVLSAMVLGQRSQVDAALNDAFVRTGAAHYLAASGLHVGWLALIGWWLMRLVGLPSRQCAVAVAMLIIAYVALAEPRPSILRAGAIGVLACFGIYRAGVSNTLNWLAASAILLLMLDPTDLFRPAFQLSFVAVLSIVYLQPVVNAALTRRVRAFQKLDALDAAVDSAIPIPLTPRLPRKRDLIANAILRAVRLTLTASIAVWIANVPLACFHFNRFAPFGWIYNLLLWVPAFCVTALGFLKVLLALLFPSSVILTGPALQMAIAIFLAFVQTLAAIPGSLLGGNNPSLTWVVAVYGVIALRIWRPALFERRPATLAIYAILILWWLIPARWVRRDAGALNVWVLAVGDGTGTIIELPDGRAMLFDFGTRSPFDASATALAFLEHRAIHEIDTAFVTHANFDHYGAMINIHKSVPIRKIIISDQFQNFVKEKDGAWRFLEAMRDAGASIETLAAPKEWTNPTSVRFEVLSPPPSSISRAPSANDTSLALRLTYEGKSILLTGDQSEWGLGQLVALPDIHADALALPHHGSVVSNTRRFIDTVNPSIAVRSTGQRRTLTTNGIEQIVGNARRYLTTADDGCIRLRIKNHNLEATPFITP
ncbi:MAG: ComEC/Rec2 family competence protein [Phycisphaerales bacterium]|nr:ComEC/Rec2 family competence protein [Phycisphaerales bacterium]MCB9858546.1 ComEC/Rec2 family competence protein [Phycisphaerales bacterium]